MVSFCLGLVVVGRAEGVVYSLVMPAAAVPAAAVARVDVIVMNPAVAESGYDLPVALAGRLRTEDQSWPLELRAIGSATGRLAARNFTPVGYTFDVPAAARGTPVLELDEPARLRGVLEIADRSDRPEPVATAMSRAAAGMPAENAVKRTFGGRIGVHEPIYFLYGSETPAAKFQFSFKYRLLGDKAALRNTVPALRGLYLGYTQRSLWDIEAESSPFHDTSYMPELFVESQTMVDPGSGGGAKWLGYQVGYKHESNGRSGLDSRSLNIVYARTALAFGRVDGWSLLLIPRVYSYVSDLSNNPDIAKYRGYADLVIVIGRNEGPALSLAGQLGRDGNRGSLQADLNIPVKVDRIFDFATYIHLQYWSGYGESLLDYNRKSTALRAGISLVR
ncbi:MAG: phospholipase A [Opitutaceae bacterium]|nr:phospholipase A [Opitutaceae bacterium]